ncbi:hypothetical protein DINM_001602 [Dirofilaria immitis]|nr:hypothetical protein [Dirofilaria immitis]
MAVRNSASVGVCRIQPIDKGDNFSLHHTVVIIIATGLLRGILTFNKQLIRMHLYFDYFALTFNVITSILFLPALFLTNSDARNFTNILLILCFLTQIPLQIWAIVVTRSCLEFFLLVHVLVGLAEK